MEAPTTQQVEDMIREACHVAVSELPSDTATDDMLDCVFGQLPVDQYLGQATGFALHWLRQYGHDISDQCESHEPDPEDNRPMGISVYCDGRCQARSHI